MNTPARIFIIAGIVLLLVGVGMMLGAKWPGRIGHLPGDIRIVRENFRFYFPITTMVLFSLLLSIIIWIFRKIF